MFSEHPKLKNPSHISEPPEIDLENHIPSSDDPLQFDMSTKNISIVLEIAIAEIGPFLTILRII